MKKRLIRIILLCLTLLPIKALAVTGSLNISCGDAKVKAGETATCTITGTIDTAINSIDATFSLSENLTFVSYTSDSIWSAEDGNNNKIQVYPQSGDDISGNFTLGVLKVKVNNNTVNKNETVLLTNIEFNNDNVSDDPIYIIERASGNIRVPNNVNTLKSLSIDGLTLNPKFNSNTISYSTSTTTDSIKIKAVATDENAKVNVNGPSKLENGNNTFKIIVTAEDGTTKTYTISVNAKIDKPATNDDDNDKETNNNQSSNDTKNDKTENEVTKNAKTGDSIIYIVLLIMGFAIGYMIYYFKTKKNK